MTDKGLLGPVIDIQHCCPGIKKGRSKKNMCLLEERIDGKLDFTGVLFALVCMDNVEIAEHFQQGGWAVIRDYCAPFNICEQLEKVDKMLGGDEEQRKVDVDNFLRKIGEQDMLFCYSVLESRWEAYKLAHDKTLLEKRAYLWLFVSWLFRAALLPLQQLFATALHQGDTLTLNLTRTITPNPNPNPNPNQSKP
jgi:hypothetical protein